MLRSRAAREGQVIETNDIQLLMGMLERHDVEDVRQVTTFAGVRKGKGITIDVMDSLVAHSLTRYLVTVTDSNGHVLVGSARARALDALAGFPWFKLD